MTSGLPHGQRCATARIARGGRPNCAATTSRSAVLIDAPSTGGRVTGPIGGQHAAPESLVPGAARHVHRRGVALRLRVRCRTSAPGGPPGRSVSPGIAYCSRLRACCSTKPGSSHRLSCWRSSASWPWLWRPLLLGLFERAARGEVAVHRRGQHDDKQDQHRAEHERPAGEHRGGGALPSPLSALAAPSRPVRLEPRERAARRRSARRRRAPPRCAAAGCTWRRARCAQARRS